MASDLIVRALARVPLFQGLTLAQLSEIARRAEQAIYHPGAMIIEENAVGDGAVLLISGEAVRVSGPELSTRLEAVSPGSLLGESAMMVETTYGSTVVARGQVCALLITREALHAQMIDDPSIADQIVQNIAGRLLQLGDELRRVDAILAGEEMPSGEGSASAHMLAGAHDPASLPAPIH